jgi:hypothetical protein
VVDEIEQRDKKRIDAIQAKIANIVRYQQCAGHDSAETTAAINELNEIIIDDSYGEFATEAQKQRDIALEAQEAEHTVALKREDDARELARLRKEADERAQAERAENLRKESEERARAEADAAAERKVKEAERTAEAERQRAQKAEDDRIAAAAKAEREKQDAIQAERDRAAAETKKAQDETAAREANKKHRAKIHAEALAVLKNYTSEDKANQVIEAIAKGQIPNVEIKY